MASQRACGVAVLSLAAAAVASFVGFLAAVYKLTGLVLDDGPPPQAARVRR